MSKTATKSVVHESLSREEFEALRDYAREKGHFWKASLRLDWMRASLSGPIHALRNASYFGPEGLDKFRLKDAEAHFAAARREMSLSVTYRVTDPVRLVATAIRRCRANGFDADYVPASYEECLLRVSVTENDSPAPLDEGFEIVDHSESVNPTPISESVLKAAELLVRARRG